MWQTDRTLVIVGRRKARVAALIANSAPTVAGHIYDAAILGNWSVERPM